eukprot:gnl/TRDRNA2_/TRDRNA2_196291_c0_seq1.p1 gnl/TRDRNA2_/TRDRNA2_196291_c0~~gnl/TRDRNA2_/TRDRNA2_196291_c0_seq1.p1  ORF type:complete len:250 (+),score=45.62 gnl/TRDRNA2_/TRDRNA2_196291_c0_seq1:135-884(+)
MSGEDTEGKEYTSLEDLWKKETGTDSARKNWYAKAVSYWEGQAASLDGVLGGYAETHGPDLRESKRFLELIKKGSRPPNWGRVLDCGAGIGRVARGLLLNFFQRVDLVEPNQKLLSQARVELTDPRVEQFILSTLQNFSPECGGYDVIWAQWVLLYLPDDDLIAFFKRCQTGLGANGMIVVKENVVLEGNWVIDREDNSISRTDDQYKAVFRKAGLQVVHEMRQSCWPTDLIPVKMYALRQAEIVGQAE